MTLLVDHHSGSRLSELIGLGLRAAASGFVALLRWPLKLYANRQLLNRMASMSDHELADIGLSRSDLLDSTALPFDREAGSFLAGRARDRRRH